MSAAPHFSLLSPNDSKVIARLHAETFPEAPWDAEWLSTMLTKPTTSGWLASVGNEPAGFLLTTVIAGEAEILSIGTRPRFQRRGIADALLTRLTAEPLTSIFLDVSAANEPARTLYARHGFVETGRRTAYYQDGSDALLLRKQC
jgi:ribosomal-protein-alanine N-acetyltransferase